MAVGCRGVALPNTRLIKRRITSAKNIAKITKAMEMVSASKMRRAQDQVRASKPYSDKLTQVLQAIARHTDNDLHPLLATPTTGVPVVVILATDRGLCGPLNSNLFKTVLAYKNEHPNLTAIVVGKKAQEFARRIGMPIHAAFVSLPEKVRFVDVLPLVKIVREGFLDGQFSAVTVFHMEFINTLKQQPTGLTLLPLQSLIETTIGKAAEGTTTAMGSYIFEPSAREILEWLLPYFVEMKLYHLFLDARASEHSARMISMQSASNNARDVMSSLQLEYNKGRQAAITSELIEITTASLSIQGQS
jgi:F-type H+-transporting ATPase subunit gamma